MPALKLMVVSERLLDSLSMILVGQPFRPLGAEPPRGSSNVARDLNLLQVFITSSAFLMAYWAQASAGGQLIDTLVLALRILGTFEFSGLSIFPRHLTR